VGIGAQYYEKYLILLNCALKNSKHGKFYVMFILPHLKNSFFNLIGLYFEAEK
jgi:hypothetical protein